MQSLRGNIQYVVYIVYTYMHCLAFSFDLLIKRYSFDIIGGGWGRSS